MAMIVDAARRYSSTMRAPAAHGIVWAVVFPATSLGPHTNRLYPIHSSLSRLVQEWRCFSTGTPADFMADLDGVERLQRQSSRVDGVILYIIQRCLCAHTGGDVACHQKPVGNCNTVSSVTLFRRVDQESLRDSSRLLSEKGSEFLGSPLAILHRQPRAAATSQTQPCRRRSTAKNLWTGWPAARPTPTLPAGTIASEPARHSSPPSRKHPDRCSPFHTSRPRGLAAPSRRFSLPLSNILSLPLSASR